MVEVATFRRDILEFIKVDLDNSIFDRQEGLRTKTSKFVMTSYPKRNVIYPLITLKITNIDATRAGMQTTAMDIVIDLEVRVWANNEKDKDTLADQVFDRLRKIQFTNLGSIENDLHDFTLLSSVNVEEDGDLGIKSNVATYQYKFYNVN